MRLRLLAGLAALTLAGPSHAQEMAPSAPPLDLAAETGPAVFSDVAIEDELRAARSWLQLSLVDYESARFMNVQMVLISPDRRNRRNVVLAVCGQVNSRNRMGGYTGFHPFWFGAQLAPSVRGGISGMAGDVCGPANRLSATDYSDRLAPDASEPAR